MRNAWQIIVVAVLLLSYAASAAAGDLMRAGWLPDSCTSAHTEHHSDDSNHSHDGTESQHTGTGHCHCLCHGSTVPAIVHLGVALVPASFVISVPEAGDETAQDGPVIGIDHPPQLA
ncbi:DUF2946 family protein [Verrucomicrobiota bacterium sgz303538]